MLLKYSKFLNESILESVVNESIIYFSPDFRKSLKRVKGNKIATDLLDSEATDIKPDVTFINLDDKEGYISFTTMKNAWKRLSEKYPNVEYITSDEVDKKDRISVADQIYLRDAQDVYSKSRNPLKIGKFVNKVLPGKYNSQDIEEFTNKFKAGIDNAKEKFVIVEGSDIAKWYSGKNYKEISGQLGNSCMRNSSPTTFEMYVDNPDVCRMLILVEDDKLIGRALIWKLKSITSYNKKDVPKEGYFMDRQYTIKDSDVDKFKNYAKENGWFYKTRNNHHTLGLVSYKEDYFDAQMEVEVESKDYSRYPYMDTFRLYNPNTGLLYNNDDESEENQGMYLLSDTGGGYDEVSSGVWSSWYERNIPEDEAIWSDWADSYLQRDDAINVDAGSYRNHGWYPTDCEDIVYDEWNDISIHIDDAVYSENYGYWILSEKAIQIISEVNEDGDVEVNEDHWYHEDDDDVVSQSEYDDTYWFRRLSESFSNWYDYGIESSLLTKNYDNEYILKLFRIDEYKVKSQKENSIGLSIDYLTELDADVLGYEIDKEEKRVTDKFEYFYNNEEILESIYKRYNSEISRLSDILLGKGQQRIEFPGDNKEEIEESLKTKLLEMQIGLEDITNGVFIDFEE